MENKIANDSKSPNLLERCIFAQYEGIRIWESLRQQNETEINRLIAIDNNNHKIEHILPNYNRVN